MALIDPKKSDFGLDQPAFDPEAFLEGLASLDDANESSNASDGFEYDKTPGLLFSFDEILNGIPLNDLNQPDFSQSSSATPVNCFTQLVSNSIPAQAPYSQMPYNPSIGIAYPPEDTDANNVRTWENLIAQTNFANAGVRPSAPQIMGEETVRQGFHAVDSPDSLFDSSESESVEIFETPSPSLSTPCPLRAPATTTAPSNAATKVIVSSYL